jgi:hypothetical protein
MKSTGVSNNLTLWPFLSLNVSAFGIQETETEKRENLAPNHLRKISKRCWLASPTNKNSRLFGRAKCVDTKLRLQFHFPPQWLQLRNKICFLLFLSEERGHNKSGERREAKEARHVAHGTPQIVTSTPEDGNGEKKSKNISCD